MTPKTRLTLSLLLGGFFLLLDQIIKYAALNVWTAPVLINPHTKIFGVGVNKFLGWHPYLNPGIGFGIPLPNWLIVAVSIPILILLIYILIHSLRNYSLLLTPYSLSLILTGALSNFIDRVIYHHTIDYIFILTGYINLADVIIVVGFAMYLISLPHTKDHNSPPNF